MFTAKVRPPQVFPNAETDDAVKGVATAVVKLYVELVAPMRPPVEALFFPLANTHV